MIGKHLFNSDRIVVLIEQLIKDNLAMQTARTSGSKELAEMRQQFLEQTRQKIEATKRELKQNLDAMQRRPGHPELRD